MIIVHVSENVGTFIPIILERTPDHLHSFIVKSNFFVLIVDSSKEEGVEAQLTEKRSGGGMMSKRINMPGYVRNIVECLFEPS